MPVNSVLAAYLSVRDMLEAIALVDSTHQRKAVEFFEAEIEKKWDNALANSQIVSTFAVRNISLTERYIHYNQVKKVYFWGGMAQRRVFFLAEIPRRCALSG